MTRRYKPNRKYKSRRKQRNSKKGGQFLRAGTTGCVFRPNLKCKASEVRDNKYVSKLMPAGSGQSEYDFTKFLAPIDAENRYFVYPSELPYLDVEAEFLRRLNTDEDLTTPTLNSKTCGLTNQTSFDILKMRYGGEDLEVVTVYNNELFLLLKGLLNVFEGLLLLHKNGYMHNDIKDKNIVALWEDGSFNVRVIDFGQTGKVDGGTFHIWNRNNYFWSYDFRLYRTNKGADDDINNDSYSTDRYRREMSTQSFPLMFLHSNNGEPINDAWAADLNRRINALDAPAQDKLLMTCETYSLGVTLYKLYNRITGHNLTDANTIETPKQADKTAAQCLVNNLSRPLFDLILKMCSADPFNRLTLENAYTGYKTLIEKAEKTHVDGLLTVGSKWRKRCIIANGNKRIDIPDGTNEQACLAIEGACYGPLPPGAEGPWCYKPAGPRK